MKSRTYKEYTFGPGLIGDFTVFIFKAGPYRATNKLRPFHKSFMVWSVCDRTGMTATGHHRARQVDRICRLSAARCTVKPF